MFFFSHFFYILEEFPILPWTMDVFHDEVDDVQSDHVGFVGLSKRCSLSISSRRLATPQKSRPNSFIFTRGIDKLKPSWDS